MSNSYNYNPVPPRVWSRVQNPCTYTDGSNNFNYSPVYIPITNQTVSLAQANYEEKQFYKGNVLQYKGNSSRLTKKQKYTQLAKGFGPNRTKVFATQTQTYTNPNTSGLLRVNYTTYPYPNQIVGAPNNPSGPFQYNVPNPFDCSSNSIQDGGNLVCGTYANPCTGQIIQTGAVSATICNPASASNVPGPSVLCWNNKIQTWFPRQNLTMSNSLNKWPQGYKGLISAVTLSAPVLSGNLNNDFSVTLNWSLPSNECYNVSNWNIYQNGILIQNVPYPLTSTIINNLTNENTYIFYVVGFNNGLQSQPSNSVSIYIPDYIATGSYIYSNITYLGTNYNIVTFTGTGTITFSITTVNTICVGGGGGGGGAINTLASASGGGGGGGGQVITSSLNTNQNNIYSVIVGLGGSGGLGGTPGSGTTTGGTNGNNGNPSYISTNSSIILNSNGGSGGYGSFNYALTPEVRCQGGQSGSGGVGGSGGGGGGAGNNGNYVTTPTNGGGGGAGVYSGGFGGNGSLNISVPIYSNAFGSGGGGGSWDEPGGIGGNSNAGTGGSGNSGPVGSGTANTGGGGGGGGNVPGGNGGSGVVIFYWPL